MAGLTALPNGLSSMGNPVTGGTYLTTGSVYFVDSNTGKDSNDGKDPDHPFATVDHGVAHCTSGKMDMVFVMPNHAETISSSTGMRISVSGVKVVGLGSGEQRPTFTLDTAVASKCEITGHSAYLENLLFKSGIDAITYGIHVSATDVTLKNIEWRDDATNNYQVGTAIATSSSGAGGCIIDGFVLNNPVDPGGTRTVYGIHMRSPRRCEIKNCYINTDTSHGIYSSTGVAAGAGGYNLIRKNFLQKTGSTSAPMIEWSSDAKGSVVCDNIIFNPTTDGEDPLICDTGSFLFRNFIVNQPGEVGIECEVVGTT